MSNDSFVQFENNGIWFKASSVVAVENAPDNPGDNNESFVYLTGCEGPFIVRRSQGEVIEALTEALSDPRP